MSDRIKPPSNFGTTGPRQPRTPAPRRDAPGSVGAFDPVHATSHGFEGHLNTGQKHSDFIENSKDPVMTTHVANHIVHGSPAPDKSFGVRHASSEYPGKGKPVPYGDYGATDGGGVGYLKPGHAGHKV